jgi:hypothetical protein
MWLILKRAAARLKLIRVQLGEPEVLLFNAAACPLGNVSELIAAQFKDCMRVDALGAFLCAKRMRPADESLAAAESFLQVLLLAWTLAQASSITFGPGNFVRQTRTHSVFGA